MKNNRLFLKLVLALSVIVILELLGIVATAQDMDLELVHTDQDKSWYINTRTMVNPAPGTVSFWNKIVPSKGSGYFARMGAVLEKARKNPGRLEYVQVLQELECGTNRVKVWNVIFYDRQNRIIYSSTAPKTTGEVLAFQQETGSVRNAVCSTSYLNAPERPEQLAELQAPFSAAGIVD
ncbi:MAG: hypothetical protein A2X58_05655 [Nitrospirae bacterium GWC2_56_14]|nr:MAG: hypothetical protein A2X58_05655 [Nitrospirae bacterium GWC2_56_14]HBB67310.1 hypothetical protein [Elusimicrobiota bacterium]